MNITVTKRGPQSKGERKKSLKQGLIPGSVYGKGLEPVSVDVPARALVAVLTAGTGMNTIIDLTIAGDKGKHSVMLDNLERNAITRGFESVGFHQVLKGDKVTAQIPIHLVGSPPSVGTGEAVLEHTLETITVHAQPADLPEHLDVDIAQMNVGDVLHVSDLPHNAKLEFTTADTTAIAALHYSRTAAAVEESESPATAPEATAATEAA